MKDIKESGEIIFEKILELEERQTSIFEYLGEIVKVLGKTRMGLEVEDKCGERYNHEKPNEGQYSRYGSQPGSLKLGIERIPIDVPRIKDNETEKILQPESYQKMRSNPPGQLEDLYRLLIGGLKQKEYKKVAQSFEDSFGLSQSNVSKHFVEISSKVLEDFENRSLENYDIMVLYIDGKYFGSREIIHCVGVTSNGHKVCLGFIETASENSRTIKEFFGKLIERGLQYEQGILVVADGSKGIRKATKEVFGKYALFQRCQWHKRENIVGYLPEEKQEYYRRKIQNAYEEVQYEAAKAKLKEVQKELDVDSS